MSVFDQIVTDKYAMYHTDNVEALRAMPDGSIDYILYSPPFCSLYVYSASDYDFGNVRGKEEFFAQYQYLTQELHRILRPGRLMSVHCMLLPTLKSHDGIIGLYDFRGDLIRHHIADQMIYHSEVVIWRDPVVSMQRTKAIGLLYKQLRKDSNLSRQGIPDYLVTFRKPGENPCPITKTHEGFPVERWQRYASPVWMDINPSDTLQRLSAREEEDEKHIAPLQLEVIKRGIELWTNPGEVVLDPFAGIGSTGYAALQMDRRFVGCELKTSYYQQACANLANATRQLSLLS